MKNGRGWSFLLCLPDYSVFSAIIIWRTQWRTHMLNLRLTHSCGKHEEPQEPTPPAHYSPTHIPFSTYILSHRRMSSLGTEKTLNPHPSCSEKTPGSLLKTVSGRQTGKGKHGFWPSRIWFCSSVSKLLAQRYTAESWGCVVWTFRVESFALGIWAENRSLGIPVSSIGAWLRKEIRNSSSFTVVCLYQETPLCPGIGSHLRVASWPIFVTLCLGVWVTPAFVGSEEKQKVVENKECNCKRNKQCPKLQILYFRKLTCSQETKDHAWKEPGGHRKTRQWLHP